MLLLVLVHFFKFCVHDFFVCLGASIVGSVATGGRVLRTGRRRCFFIHFLSQFVGRSHEGLRCRLDRLSLGALQGFLQRGHGVLNFCLLICGHFVAVLREVLLGLINQIVRL